MQEIPDIVVLIIVFTALFSITTILLILLRRSRDPGLKRIKELHNAKAMEAIDTLQEEDSSLKDTIKEKAEKIIAGISHISKTDKEKTSKVRENLIQAGYHREDIVKTFIGLKIISTILLILIFIYLGLLLNRELRIVLILSSLFGLVGYNLPDLVLGFKIKKRQGIIANGLPDALDLLVITVEAGLGLNAAILKVSDDLEIRCAPLSREFARVNQDLRTGASREEALRKLSDRNQVEDLRIFVGAVILADRLGTSIADTLRAQADSLRTRIRQKAEQQAAKAGIKMLLPLVLFILPALIIILMGPGLIAVIRTLNL
jgi:tight adherence protein C